MAVTMSKRNRKGRDFHRSNTMVSLFLISLFATVVASFVFGDAR